MFNPLADKLPQGAMPICLVARFLGMWLLLLLLAVKEAFVGIAFLLAIRKSGAVAGIMANPEISKQIPIPNI